MSNSISGIFTLGRDAELKYSGSGMAILSFTAANNTGFGDKKRVTWYRVTLFGKRAEGKLIDFLKKGAHTFIVGEISQSAYTAQDGTEKTTLEINCTTIELVGGKQGEQPPRVGNQPSPRDNFDDDEPF